MLNNATQLRKLSEVAGAVCLAHGVQLVDARFATERGVVLKVLIERPGAEKGAGVSVDDCQAVSRDLGTALEVEDNLMPPGGFRLEVGSPGLERPLFKLEDFVRFTGREVRVRTARPDSDGRRKYEGELIGVEGDSIRMRIDGRVHELNHANVEKANLVHRF